MTDTESRNAADLPGSENADWGHPSRENAAQEQSAQEQSAQEQSAPEQPSGGPSGWAHPIDADPQRRAGSQQTSPDPAAAPGGDDGSDADDDALPGDGVPGDGSVGRHPPSPDVDVVVTAGKGRETDAARADTSESTPAPRETPAG